jgi:hypothetical protein
VVEGFLSSFRLLVIAKKKLTTNWLFCIYQEGKGKVRISSLALVEIFFWLPTQAKGNVALLHPP